ncbi:hypothetical protein DFP72DRAFT_488798 [Ephemerocybe angulata]|uniref:TERF2-interacting telomeric protein 1 Myb domain-containing protein n=1 Tax=Ephemerocybe angulata TaxID=980116 RepID=A0A8H6IFD0_9AGAR|nr:hypothetical protein DFP72DRAFT_488798 [Tulosesus angulatus]
MSDAEEHPPIFIKEGTNRPLRIYLALTLSKQLRKEWNEKIELYGGKVAKVENDADVVVVSNTLSIHELQILRYRFVASTDKKKQKVVVETSTWFNRCLDEKSCTISPPPVKGMPGQVRTEFRVSFTEEDDDHLARYITRLIPDPEAGGLTGNEFYQILVSSGEVDPEYAWALRHPWQSWRNRYKDNAATFQQRVELLIPLLNPTKQHNWHRDRRLNKSQTYREEEYEDVDANTYEEEEESEDEKEQPASRFDKAKENDEDEDDDVQRQPRSAKGKGRASSRDEDDQENATFQDWESRRDPASPGPEFFAASRGFKSAGSSNPGDSGVSENQNGSSRRQRRHSFEETPKKRPRVARQERSHPIRMARRPPGFIPGGGDSPEDERNSSDDTGEDSEDIAHSLFSEDRGEREITMGSSTSGEVAVSTSFDTVPGDATGAADVVMIEDDDEGREVVVVEDDSDSDGYVQEVEEEEEEDVLRLVTNEDKPDGGFGTYSGNQEAPNRNVTSSPSKPSSDDAQTMTQISMPQIAYENPPTIIKKQPRRSDALLQAFHAQKAVDKGKIRPRPSLPADLTLARDIQFKRSGAGLHNGLASIPGKPSTSTNQKTRGSSRRAPAKVSSGSSTPTPTNRGQTSRLEAASTASDGEAQSLPLPGTRAGAYMRRLEEAEKHTPYTPPSGTRAASYLQKQAERR